MNGFIFMSGHLHDPSLMGVFGHKQTNHSGMKTHHHLTAQYIIIQT